MKSVFVNDLRPNQDVITIFLVQSKEVRRKKSGEPYLSLTLVDKTGDIDAKMWDGVAEVMETFERDDFVKVKGRVQVYQNRPQLTVHKLQRHDDSEVDFANFFPASERDPEEMFAELREFLNELSNPHIKALLNALMDDQEIAGRFKRAPAAKSVHHAFLGGLLEHVLSLCGLCKAAAAHYPFVDLNLMIAGAVLHDIGKIEELSYRRSFGYSDTGQLLGHLVIGLRMINDKLRGLPDFPPRLRILVEHIVVSHHGTLEFGSPKVPAFPEALLFHFLDNLDSKMENMRALTAKDKLIEGCWTSYSRALGHSVLKKDEFLHPSEAVAKPDAPATSRTPTSRDGDRHQASLFGEKLQSALRREL